MPYLQDRNIDQGLANELADVRKVLQLDPERPRESGRDGATAAKPNEIAILSRSIIRILSELATFVDVPVEHLVSGKAPPIGNQQGNAQPPFRVLSGAEKPCDPFVAVCF